MYLWRDESERDREKEREKVGVYKMYQRFEMWLRSLVFSLVLLSWLLPPTALKTLVGLCEVFC